MSRLIAFLFVFASLPGWADKFAKGDPKVGDQPEPVLFALKQVHPQNEKLVTAIKNGESPPPGYQVVRMVLKNPDGKPVGETPIVLNRKNIITEKFVKFAEPNPGEPGTVMVQLAKKGGKRLERATEKMQLGQDRMAIVFKDRCLCAPVVQSVLSTHFLIQGLDGKKEVNEVIKALTAKDQK
jgi:preprotein translocase subunit SecD